MPENEELIRHICSHLVRMGCIPDDAVIVDAGACVGDFAAHFANTRSRIIVIECCPPHVNALRAANRYEVIDAALVGEGEEPEAAFKWDLGAPVRGNIVGDWKRMLGQSTHVRTITLRAVLDECGIDRVDLLKMDIEGSEAGVLRTMTPDLAQRIRQIAAEAHPSAISTDEACEILTRLGYEVVRGQREYAYEVGATRGNGE